MIKPEKREIGLCHELGHLIVAMSILTKDRLQGHKSIIRTNDNREYFKTLLYNAPHVQKESAILDNAAILLGGFAAEKAVFGISTENARQDHQRATKLVSKYVLLKKSIKLASPPGYSGWAADYGTGWLQATIVNTETRKLMLRKLDFVSDIIKKRIVLNSTIYLQQTIK